MNTSNKLNQCQLLSKLDVGAHNPVVDVFIYRSEIYYCLHACLI